MESSKERGITLLALIITIIVISILTNVTIKGIAGENGLIKQTKGIAEQNKKEIFKQEVQLDLDDVKSYYWFIDKLDITLEDIGKCMHDFHGYEVDYSDLENGTITVMRDGGIAVIDDEFNIIIEGVPIGNGGDGGNKPVILTGIVSYSTKEETESAVLVTITTNREIEIPVGWIKVDETHYTKLYTSNVYELLAITDLEGNSIGIGVEIKNIVT